MAYMTTSDLQKIVKLQKEDGRQHLRQILQWHDFDEECDLRAGICLDFVYENILFAVNKGFPWKAVGVVAKLSEELLTDTKGTSMMKAVQLLKDKLFECSPVLNEKCQLAFLAFLMRTFFRHYRLYQYVLCSEMQVHRDCLMLQVHAPPHPLPLTEGVYIKLWEYQKTMESLCEKEAQKQRCVQDLRDSAQSQAEKSMEALYGSIEIPDTDVIEKQVLEKLVQQTLKTQLEIVRDLFAEELKLTREILELKQQQKALPQPPTLPPFTSKLVLSKQAKPPSGKKAKK
ncbi:uncharacterized protein C8orf74 homolog [Erpetoichthys calabaricus]|uniref:Chromosome 8 open reading frame 74 n=1 Tax=Erpetoichthys calabaricus TaxID=27687 RepID=A0A8C4RZ23_ERPCA|nr:uncharacterized protein C8orf74 homolog [Erpetoichthys calabaricus]